MQLADNDRDSLVRHAVLGLICFALNLLLMWLLVAVLGLHVLAATSICFLVLNLISHHFSRSFVFKYDGQAYANSLIRFLLVMVANFALNLAAMATATQWLEIPYLFASALIAGLFFFGNFIVHRDWTFS